MQSTAQAFSYLRSKVREWKAGDLLPTWRDQSWERFQAIATIQLTPSFFNGLSLVLKKVERKQLGNRYHPFRTSAEIRQGPEAKNEDFGRWRPRMARAQIAQPID